MRLPSHFILPALLGGCSPATASLTADDATPIMVPNAPEVRVETARLEPSSASLVLQLPGEVTGSRDAHLASPLGGYVESVRGHKGDHIDKGQVIARINTSVYVAQRDQAQAQSELAQGELERMRALGDLASPAQLQAVETRAKVAKAAAELAQIQVSRSIIRAPFSGVLGQMDLEVGEVVGPGSPIARLVRLDPVQVSVSVSDRDITTIQPGMPVTVSTDAFATPLAGHVIHVDPAADLSTRTFVVDVELPNPDAHLLPGMIATVLIQREVVEQAIVIPQGWLVTQLDGVGVFVDQEAHAEWRPVSTGEVIRDQVVITEGLSAGEVIVTTGQRDLADGDPLLISRTGTCCTGGRATF